MYVAAKVIPVIIRSNGNQLKVIQTLPEQCTGKTQNKGTTTAILGTVHILRTVLI
jgi:hypothetical protein